MNFGDTENFKSFKKIPKYFRKQCVGNLNLWETNNERFGKRKAENPKDPSNTCFENLEYGIKIYQKHEMEML